MTREEGIAIAEHLVDVVNRHDIRQILALYDANAVTMSPTAGQISGIAAISQWWETIFARFPDWTVRLSDVMVDGDRIAIMGTAGATDRSGWFGQPPTGEPFAYSTIVLLTMRNGKILRDERVYDLSGVLERFEKTRTDKELKLAAEIQRALLSCTTRRTSFGEVAGDSLPCRAIGGDFFEVAELLSGDLAVALGDVSGKGAGAALLASMVQGMFAAEVRNGNGPSTTVERLNGLVAARHIEPRFATFFYGALSPDGAFSYCNAGHNPPVVIGSGGVRRLTTGGPILGTFPGARYEQERIALGHGDTVIVFSDGVVEARNSADQEFGDDQLLSQLADAHVRPVVDVLQSLLTSVQEFCAGAPQGDDITVLVARYTKPV